MRSFRNPANDAVCEISDGAWLWSLLFGPFYFVSHGAWGPAVIYLGAALVLLPTIIGTIIVWIIGAIVAQDVVAKIYLRRGWIEVDTPAPSASKLPRRDPWKDSIATTSKPVDVDPEIDPLGRVIKFRDPVLQAHHETAGARHDELLTEDSPDGQWYRRGFEQPENVEGLPARGTRLYAVWAAGHNRVVTDEYEASLVLIPPDKRGRFTTVMIVIVTLLVLAAIHANS